jgi:signal transduction histidine kinase
VNEPTLLQRNQKVLILASLAVLIALGRPTPLQAQEPVILTEESGEYPLGLHLELLEDKDKVWTIDDVTSPEISKRFVPSQVEVPNLGFTDSAYWVRYRVSNEADALTKWLLAVEANLFFIDVYVPAVNPQGYEVTKTGTALPFGTRDVSHPGFVFDLSLTPGEVQIIYVRVESEGALSLPLTIWSQEALARRDFTKQALNGFVYGVLIIMAGYNFGLFLFLRDRSYLYFVLFLLSLLGSYFWQENFGHQYLWPNLVRFNAIAGQFFFVLGLIFVLKFTSTFLQTKTHTPRLHKVINILTITFGAVIPLQFIDLGISARPVLVLTVVSIGIIVAVSFIVWRQGFKPARYFLLAWLLLLTSNGLFVLSLFDFLPLTVFAVAGSLIGLVILILTLSLALADRINTLRREKEAAQVEVVKSQELAKLEERTRLARDLHDSTTQALYSAMLFSDTGKKLTERGDLSGAEYYQTRVSQVLRQALKEMRLLVFQLRPPVLEQEGLANALRLRLDAVESRAGMEAHLEAEETPPLPEEVIEGLYRIALEALNNALRHAKAATVTVKLQSEGDVVTLEIIDDGQGFDLEAVKNGQGGLGLINMQERASNLGTDLSIESAPDQGTKVRVTVAAQRNS